MSGFADEALVEVHSGHGGRGAVSFRREKYVPRGGPDGGDGGRGGDVLLVVRRNLKTLSHLRQKRHYKAENGQPGGKRNKTGADGQDVILAVPPGTVVRDADSGDLLRDLTSPGESWLCLQGGRGGKGNRHFATSTHRTPRFAQDGEPGAERRLMIELRLIADAGLVGLPNAGKSTLLSRLSNARPKVADYPFTTRVPHLGVVKLDDRELVLADIPGIIRGASEGAGMGLQFLKHISRAPVLLYLVDLSDPGFENVPATLEQEVHQYSAELAGRPRLVVGTKLDVLPSDEPLNRLREVCPGDEVFGISAVTGLGLKELVAALLEIVDKNSSAAAGEPA